MGDICVKNFGIRHAETQIASKAESNFIRKNGGVLLFFYVDIVNEIVGVKRWVVHTA